MPPSLKVIAKEIEKEGLKSGFFDSDIPAWRELNHWVDQGVFLLNTALTVEEKLAGSHLGYWQWFTREVIKIISSNASFCVWMLWGAKAQSFKDYIKHHVHIKDETDAKAIIAYQAVLLAPHPAAELYATGKSATFTGCNHFNLANIQLSHNNNKIINW